MSDLRTLVSSLRRPRLLIRAARIGLSDYKRERDLCRIVGQPAPPAPPSAVRALLDREAAIEENRVRGSATYSVMQHVDVMIALMAETRALPRSADPIS